MLKLAEEKELLDFCRRDAFGTKIAGYLKTYSADSAAVRFWVQRNDENIITAAVCRAYDSIVLSAESNADFEELWQFLKIIGFSTLSCEESVCGKLGLSPTRSGNIVRFEHLLRPLRGEAQMPRYPDLRDVYSLLVSSGFDRLGGRDEWIADVSRRMNRDTAQWRNACGVRLCSVCRRFGSISRLRCRARGYARQGTRRRSGADARRKIFVRGQASRTLLQGRQYS